MIHQKLIMHLKTGFLLLALLTSNYIIAQDNLPDWFLNPPVSPDNSCVYLIGISDPGLNRNEATK